MAIKKQRGPVKGASSLSKGKGRVAGRGTKTNVAGHGSKGNAPGRPARAGRGPKR